MCLFKFIVEKETYVGVWRSLLHIYVPVIEWLNSAQSYTLTWLYKELGTVKKILIIQNIQERLNYSKKES